MSGPVDAALEAAHRESWGVVVAATVRVVRDLDLAEECVQEAYADAVRRWGVDGAPDNPAAWLTTAARRRAVDVVRREVALTARLPLLVEPEVADEDDEEPPTREAPVRDERLRLLLLCCHPALAPDARSALTLRLVLGVATPDVARAFLVPEATMAARLTRAKRKIVGSGIPFRVPAPEELPERVHAVADVVLLLLTAGHTAPSGDVAVRVDLVDEALRLARLLLHLVPDDPEVRGLLALALVVAARRATRLSPAGLLVPLADQDRAAWDRAAIAEARGLCTTALPHPAAGRIALQAAIAVLHAEAPSAGATDRRQVLGLYDALLAIDPSPVVALNRAVAVAEVEGAEVALRLVDAIDADGGLAAYPYLPAVRGDLLERLGRAPEAAEAFERAAALTANGAERAFLTARAAALTDRTSGAGTIR